MLNLLKRHKTITLIIGDILVLYFSLFAALFVRYPHSFNLETWRQHLFSFSIIYIVWILIFYINDLYEISLSKEPIKLLKQFFQALLINVAFTVAFFYFKPVIAPKRNLLLIIVFFIITFYLWRHIFYLFIKSKTMKIRIGFIGLNKEVLEIIKYLIENPHLSYQVVFVLALKEKNVLLPKIPKPIKIYQGLSNLNQILKGTPLNKAIVAMAPENNPVLAKEIYHSSSDMEIVYFPNFYEEITKKVPLEMINRLWLKNQANGKSRFYNFSKRTFDIFLAMIGGIIFIIMLPFLTIAYLATDGFPIFFSQIRIGKNNKKIRIFKLRTMVKGAERERPLWAEENDVRVTSIGKFLRKFYIDELPQSANILKGEMSVIGPRPERPEFVQILEKEVTFYPLRHLVKPGVTGWAQINSFYARSIEDSIEKTKYDLYYVKNCSLLFDIDIVLKTIKMVFSKREKKNY